MIRLLSLLLLAASGAAAQGTALDALERRGELLGWEAVGRIDSPSGYCTGTLIASDVVLTAAHCVDGPVEPRSVRFRAGYRHGASFAERTATRIVIAEAYEPVAGGQLSSRSVPHDIALLALDAPISSAEADPFAILADPIRGDRVSVVSYGRGRDEALSRQASCAVTGRYADGILEFDCDVTFGSSGAPVFARQDGRLRIVSLISGGVEGSAIGMTLHGAVEPLMARLRRDGSRPKIGSGARRITVGGGGADRPSGARFIRP